MSDFISDAIKASMGNKNHPPKFNVGDRVIVWNGHAPMGKATILEVLQHSGHFADYKIQWDGGGKHSTAVENETNISKAD